MHAQMKYVIILLFLLHIFLRFYQLESRLIFTYDQLDSAWAAKRILVDHIYPILGPGNKLGSGIFIGPAYYYLISVVYFFTDLNPIAAGIFAGLTSIFNFWVIYFVTKALFSKQVAIIALFVHTVAFSSITFDRTQWEINFVPSVSLIFFYLLFRVMSGKTRLIPWLLFVLGTSYHVHLTVAVYLTISFVVTSPLWLRTKETVQKTLLASPLFLVWLLPIITGYIQTAEGSAKPLGYASSSFLGIHATRFFQVFSQDLFIEVGAFFPTWLKMLIVPAFVTVYYTQNRTRNALFLCFLVILWFVIPPAVLSVYSGEITIYYHSTTRYLSLVVGSYLVWNIWRFKYPFLAIGLLAYSIYFGYTNLKQFFDHRAIGLLNWRLRTEDMISRGIEIPFRENYPASYLYWFNTQYYRK